MTAPVGVSATRKFIGQARALRPAAALRVFSLRKGWAGVKIKKELGTLPRDGLLLAVEEAGIRKRFHLQATDGSAVGFEMARSKFATTFRRRPAYGAPHALSRPQPIDPAYSRRCA